MREFRTRAERFQIHVLYSRSFLNAVYFQSAWISAVVVQNKSLLMLLSTGKSNMKALGS